MPVYFITPKDEKIRNVIFYIHGAGWVFGSFHTHEKLVRELSARTNSLVVFPEYSLSQAVDAVLMVAGDSVGGNMAIAVTLMSVMRHGPSIQKLLLYYPVTNACRIAMDASTEWINRQDCNANS